MSCIRRSSLILASLVWPRMRMVSMMAQTTTMVEATTTEPQTRSEATIRTMPRATV